MMSNGQAHRKAGARRRPENLSQSRTNIQSTRFVRSNSQIKSISPSVSPRLGRAVTAVRKLLMPTHT